VSPTAGSYAAPVHRCPGEQHEPACTGYVGPHDTYACLCPCHAARRAQRDDVDDGTPASRR